MIMHYLIPMKGKIIVGLLVAWFIYMMLPPAGFDTQLGAQSLFLTYDSRLYNSDFVKGLKSFRKEELVYP